MKDKAMDSSRRGAKLEFEHDLNRDPSLGYERVDHLDFVRCVEHGSPTPLERWHCHDEFELQLIVGAHGRAFVGDYAGYFEPGHLVLTGPRLPHNWISTDLPPDGLGVRSLVIQFREEPIRDGMRAIHALSEVVPLLDRARHGIEFFGVSDDVHARFHRIKRCHGLERFAEFVALLSVLRRCEDYRLLSSDPAAGLNSGNANSPIKTVVEYVHEHYTELISVAQMAAMVNMSESKFSRYFSKEADSHFTAFLNRVRIHKACELLLDSEDQIANICYAVGFNNVANFNRRFREVKAVSPSEFRRNGLARLGALPSMSATSPR